MKFIGRRRQSTWRVSIYEGIYNNGEYILGKYLRGHYGRFNESMMKNTVMYDTNRLIQRRYSLPFLVTEHCLNEEVTWILPENRKPRNKYDIYGPPRTAKTPKKIMAIIVSSDHYKIVEDNNS